MKKLTFILIFLSAYFVNAQENYETIVDTTKLWSTVAYFYNPTGENEILAAKTTFYRYRGDTVLDNKHYRFLEQSRDSLHQNWRRTPYLFRDDSLNRVYVCDYNIERVLFDYTLGVGDTLFVPHGYSLNDTADSFIITNVDSIYKAEKYRLTYFIFDSIPLYSRGIGGGSGPVSFLDYSPYYGTSGILQCLSQHDELLYQRGDLCYIAFDNWTMINDKELNDFNFYPNPAKDKISWNNNSGSEVESISIFNLLGQLVLVEQIVNESNSLQLPNLKKGLYYIVVKTKNTKTDTHPLIIN